MNRMCTAHQVEMLVHRLCCSELLPVCQPWNCAASMCQLCRRAVSAYWQHQRAASENLPTCWCRRRSSAQPLEYLTVVSVDENHDDDLQNCIIRFANMSNIELLSSKFVCTASSCTHVIIIICIYCLLVS